MRAPGMGDDIQRIAADLAHGTDAVEHEAVGTGDFERQFGLAHVGYAEAVVEQADEGADRAGGVIVFGLAQQQRAAAFEVAQVDVVAQRGAGGLARRADGEHDLGLRVVPGGFRMQSDFRAASDGGHDLRLGEDFRIGSYAHFQVLRPRTLRHQHALDLFGLGRARPHRGEIVADDARHLHPYRLGLGGVTARLLLDHAFQQALHESHAARLDRLQVAGREQCRPPRVPAVAAVGEQRRHRGDDRARRAPGEGDAVGAREQLAHGRFDRGEIDDIAIGPHRDGRGAGGRARQPGAAYQGGFAPVGGQAG